MKSKALLHAVGGIDDEFIEEAALCPAGKKPRTLRWLVPAAASFLLAASLSVFFRGGPAPQPVPTDYSLRGLPVENFRLADMKTDGVYMIRMLFSDFGSLFQEGVDCFAFVRVNGVHAAQSDSDPIFDLQNSDVSVLKTVYGDCGGALQITQSVIKDHFCLGSTNLLREGAVYLLPLKQAGGEWYILGDMDVLFEVDDTGAVWSHSQFEDFRRFDGKGAEALESALRELTADGEYMLANSPFASLLQSWTLADVTITEKSGELTYKYGKFYSYSFSANEVFSTPDRPGASCMEEMSKITVFADEDAETNLTPGVRYLLFLDSSESSIYINARMRAEISEGVIKAIPAGDGDSAFGFSAFAPYDGFTTDEMRDLVARITAWREANQ